MPEISQQLISLFMLIPKGKNLGFTFLLLFLIASSCKVEIAKPSIEKELVILSDYLQPSDTNLFINFIKKRNVALKIVSIESDKIVGLFRNEGYNINGDIIMVKSMYDAYRLNKRDVLHNIDFSKELSLPVYDQNNWFRNFMAVGYDPYVFANSKYTVINTYEDLKKIPFATDFSERNMPVFLAPVYKRFSKIKANKWIQKFTQKQISLDSLANFKADSSRLKIPILTLYSQFFSEKDTLRNFANRRLKMSNNSSKGTFYNLRTLAITKDAQNYSTAKEFAFFVLQESNNLKLNKSLNTISLFDHAKSFKRYKTNPTELIHHYTTVQRILEKLN